MTGDEFVEGTTRQSSIHGIENKIARKCTELELDVKAEAMRVMVLLGIQKHQVDVASRDG